MYRLDQEANISGTCLRGHVELPPAKLVELFGEPYRDGGGSSGEFTFVDSERHAFCVYDWGDQRSGAGLANWCSMEPYAFHVGARNGDVLAFAEWLEAVVAGKKAA